MCHSATWMLDCDTASVSRGRRLLAERIAEWGVDGDDAASARMADVLLAAGEVLTNAARFCDGPIGLAVEAHRDELRVAVTDDHPGQAVVNHAGPFEESGRGLVLVEAVVDRWGQVHAGDGPGKTVKTVWFSVDVAEGSVLGRGCRRTEGQ